MPHVPAGTRPGAGTVALITVLLVIGSLASSCAHPPTPLVVAGRSAAALSGGTNTSLTFAARTNAGLMLIDLGWWGHGRALHRVLRALDAMPRDVAVVFLTHAHRDHLAAWRSVRQATFFAAEPEFALLTGAKRPRAWIPRWAERLKPTRLPRVGELAVVTFSSDTTFVLGVDTLRAYLVPGHTAGSAVYLFRGTLFLGDAVTYTRAGGFARARRGYSDDPRLAAASLERLWVRLPPGAVRYACTAHAQCSPFTPAFLAAVAR